jgi:hypothetical protein
MSIWYELFYLKIITISQNEVLVAVVWTVDIIGRIEGYEICSLYMPICTVATAVNVIMQL